MAITRIVHAAGHVRGRRLRAAASRRRRAAPVARADRQRHRRVLPDRGADDASPPAIIVHAFVTGDYAIKYVQHYSDSVQPLFYKITSYWGGLDGSILFWVFLLSVFGTVAVAVNRERHRELIP